MAVIGAANAAIQAMSSLMSAGQLNNINPMYHGLSASPKAYAEYSSCRLGRRKQSVRGSARRASAGRLVDPDAASRAAHAAMQQQYWQNVLAQQKAYHDSMVKSLYQKQESDSVLVKTSPTTWGQIAKYFKKS